MIRYTLKCDNDHGFDSWFQSSGAFDTLHAAGHVACPVCGSSAVEKALMAPAVAAAAEATEARPSLSTPDTPFEERLAAMRRQVEENSEYMGLGFAAEARAIHAGDAPDRAIWGEARPDEARALIEEGVPVAPLPFMPPRRTN